MNTVMNTNLREFVRGVLPPFHHYVLLILKRTNLTLVILPDLALVELPFLQPLESEQKPVGPKLFYLCPDDSNTARCFN